MVCWWPKASSTKYCVTNICLNTIDSQERVFKTFLQLRKLDIHVCSWAKAVYFDALKCNGAGVFLMLSPFREFSIRTIVRFVLRVENRDESWGFVNTSLLVDRRKKWRQHAKFLRQFNHAQNESQFLCDSSVSEELELLGGK